MPRPLQKRATPKPAPVMIRHTDSDSAAEVVSHADLVRRKEQREWEEYARRNGLDVREEHARLALQLGDAIVVPRYTGDIWWFVVDVNGIDRTVTAHTLLFDQPIRRTFPFALVEPHRLWHVAERNDAQAHHQRLDRHFGESEPGRNSSNRRRVA